MGNTDEEKTLIARLIVCDSATNIKFLIDTGADVSVIPPTAADKRNIKNKSSTPKFFAANNTPIKTYGQKRLQLTLGLRRHFTWNFYIADVNTAIIGSDFLKTYDLLVDMRRGRVIDRNTLLETKISFKQNTAIQLLTHKV